MFYGFRFLCQSIFAMELPEGYYWDYPGFYSIVVPYGATNDFFFSGHVGCCLICALEFNLVFKQAEKVQNLKTMKLATRMVYFSIATLCAQVFIMMATRGHYTIDLIVGVIIAHYVHI